MTDSTPTVQGVAVTVDLLGNDSDPDGDAISISGTPTVPAAQGTLAPGRLGGWVFTPAPGFTGRR